MRKKITLVASLAFAAALCAGVGAANVNADAATWTGFEITATSVRLGNGTKANPSGLRFQTVASSLTEEMKTQYPNAECYTTISFTSGGQNYSTNVPVTVWASENSWNTVLLEIPESDYGTVITAQSFIKLNETTTYETEAETSSIAKTASLVMQQTGIEDATLKAYAAGALESITLNETSGNLTAGDTVQLTATTQPAGFGVLWSSDDESIATVDNTGKVTAVGVGTTTVTASMAGKTATYTVTSKMPYSVDFENGANVYFGTDATVNASLVGVVDHNGGKAVKVTIAGDPTVAVSISHEYLNWIFYQQDLASVSFTVSADTALTDVFNKCQMGLVYKKSDGTFDATDIGGLTYVVQDDGTLLITITKDLYTSRFDENGGKGSALVNNSSIAADAAADSPYYCSIRFNLKDANGILTSGKAIYFDNLVADVPVKYDPVNNNPLEQDGTFENGVNALVTSSGALTYVDLEERVAGNNAVKFNLADSQYDIYLGLNRTYLANAFDTKGAESVTFKLYTDADGWCEKHRWTGNDVRNGDLCYHNGSSVVSIQDNVLSKADKVDGYIPVTLTKAQWEIFKNGDPTGTSDLFIYMVLGVYNNGLTDKAPEGALTHDTSVGDIYIDDIVANLPAQPELKELIDFENGANGYFGTDATVNSSLVGVVDHKGDKALKFEIGNDPTFAVSLSHEYMNWVFYQQGAASVSFTISADVALTGTYNKCQIGLVYKKADGSIAATDVGNTDIVVQEDGTLRITITKWLYTTRFDENGGKGSALVDNSSIASDAAADSPFYCSIRINLNTASGILTKGKAFYLDDFTVNK